VFHGRGGGGGRVTYTLEDDQTREAVRLCWNNNERGKEFLNRGKGKSSESFSSSLEPEREGEKKIRGQ